MISLSIHGAPGIVDLVVPSGATAMDVAREYAAQAGLPGMPLLQTSLGEMLPAGRGLGELGMQSGDVLVAVAGVHRPRKPTMLEAARNAPETPGLAAMVAALGVLAAILGGWYGALSDPDDPIRTAVVGVLLACALLGAIPSGRHRRQRAAAAPAFAAAAAFAAFFEPGAHLLPTILATCGVAAAVIAAMTRAMAPDEPDEYVGVWIVASLAVAGACALSPLMGWDARASWTILLLGSMMAARFAPSFAIDVPDEALLDLERLAVTAWSARDTTRSGRRGRIVVAADAMGDLVRSASRTVTASAVAVMVIASVSAPLLLHSARLDLDQIGARCLVFFAGSSILLAARSYRHRAAQGLLRVGGLAALLALLFDLSGVEGGWRTTFVCVALALGAISLIAAVATGRGWRSVWWARRAEVAESMCGSFAFAAAVVAAGLFRHIWEMTS